MTQIKLWPQAPDCSAKNVVVVSHSSGRNVNAIAWYVIVRSVIQTDVSVMTMHKNLEVFVNVVMGALVCVTVVMIALIKIKGENKYNGGFCISTNMPWVMCRLSM